MTLMSLTAIPEGPWLQIANLGIALVLGAIIGLEREVHAKSAGLRTHTLVAVGAALFMLVSKYGFADIIVQDHVSLDPSRIAAGIVSGIGFIGGGLIFVRGDAVRGLTTAATVWVAAGIGAAAGAGMWTLAAAATVVHLIVVWGITALARQLPNSKTAASGIDLVYRAGGVTLGHVLETATVRGFSVARVTVDPVGRQPFRDEDEHLTDEDSRRVRFLVTGLRPLAELAVALEGIEGVLAVSVEDANADID